LVLPVLNRQRQHRFQQPRLLGTVVDVVVDGRSGRRAETIATFLFDRMVGLERRLSAYDPQSELCRWRRRDQAASDAAVSADLAGVMNRALDWQRRTEGLFNPLVGQLTELWEAAEEVGLAPDEARLAAVAESIADPRYQMVDGVPTAIDDCSALNFSAMAKGYVVDRAIELTGDRFGIHASDTASILVNAGGDIRHHGGGASRVGIRDDPTTTPLRSAQSS
jgi:thiamine biosynthesis lipoprotein